MLNESAMRRVWIFLFIFFGIFSVRTGNAQSGGNGTYKFLDLPTSARSAALGGKMISVRDGDLSLVADNPALLDSTMDNTASLTYSSYVADINFGYGTYAKHFTGTGTFSAGMQYINYGTFERADEYGIRNGEFSAGEYALDFSYSTPLSRHFTGGISAKMIYSAFDSYNSFGAALDAGVHYHSEKKLFTAGMVLSNIGYQVKPYVPDNRESLPFEVSMAASYKLDKAPLRFTFHAGNLQRPNLIYDQPAEGGAFLLPNGNIAAEPDERSGFSLENLMRHTTLAAEILPSEHFHIRFGFNYLRRAELSATETSGGLAGFSLGTGFRISKFMFNYSLASYHLAGTTHFLTFAANFNEFKRKG